MTHEERLKEADEIDLEDLDAAATMYNRLAAGDFYDRELAAGGRIVIDPTRADDDE